MRKGETLSEEQKAKMAAGRARQRRDAATAEDRLAQKTAGIVLAALREQGLLPVRELESTAEGRSDMPKNEGLTEVGEWPEPQRRAPAPDYERPAAAVRALPPPSEPEPPKIDTRVERAVAFLEAVNPAIFDRTSASALLSAVRKLGDRIGQHLQQTAPGPTELRCRICGAPVNPDRPAAIRTVRNPDTGLEENAFFHSSACALMWDSGRRTMTETTNGGKGPLVALE